MLRKIRIILALVFFLGVTLLFLDFTGTARHWLGWMAKAQFLPAVLALNAVAVVALVVITLIFGRIYCSVVCPLGVMQDIIAHIGHRGKKHPYHYSREKAVLRWILLLVFVVLLVLGLVSIASLIAPYSSYGRIATNLLQPLWLWGNNVLAFLAERADSYAFYSKDVWLRSLPTFMIALISFAVIGILAWRGGRTYCNTICPVGTVLGYLSRLSWFMVYLDKSKCKHCGKCESHCKSSCIDVKSGRVDHSRCVLCGNCLDYCHFDALHYAHRRPGGGSSTPGVNSRTGQEKQGASSSRNVTASERSVDQERRSFLIGAGLVTATAALAQPKKKLDGGLAKIEEKEVPERVTPVIPPGALSMEHLSKHCTACQLCIAECPNDVLRPSTDLMHLMTPEMSFERGACRPECTRCSSVCPTGAIKPISRAEKSSTQIGHAVWIARNCIVETDHKECGNCARHCPSQAIEMIAMDPNYPDLKIPAVNEARCIGCGMCEYVCPVRPLSAIHVEGHEVHRKI